MKRAFRDPLFVIGFLYLLGLLLFAVFGPTIRTAQLKDKAGQSINFSAVTSPVAPPLRDPMERLPLGTDDQGRDQVARLAQGARVSLTVGLLVQTINLTVGILIGVLGVFAPKFIRVPLLRLTDAMFAFPDILLAVLIAGTFASLNLGIVPVVIALSITGWPSITRLTVTQVASVKDREYVVAAKAAGARVPYLVVRHILPQVIPLILAVSLIELSGTIIAESSLSFLGIGINPPAPSWGNMISSARTGSITANLWRLLPPCVMLSLTIFALNFVGDGLRAALDPKKG